MSGCEDCFNLGETFYDPFWIFPCSECPHEKECRYAHNSQLRGEEWNQSHVRYQAEMTEWNAN